ncbi:MAG: hypothetical protein WBP72_07995, partial [Rhodocyclaceae bacterium]
HAWLYNRKPSKVGNNTLKYQRVDPRLRERMRAGWNQPVVWPMALTLGLVALFAWPAVRGYRRREAARGLSVESARFGDGRP